MPFGSYNENAKQAVRNVNRMIKETMCDCVKMEGGVEMAETIRAVVVSGTPVMGHIGMTPQTAGTLGGFRAQGGTPEGAKKLLDDALTLQEAGVFSIVVECVPSSMARMLRGKVRVPILGIGAGPDVDCQVLVAQDMLGMYGDFRPKFVKHFAKIRGEMIRAINQFHAETLSGEFPAPEYSFNKEVALDKLYG